MVESMFRYNTDLAPGSELEQFMRNYKKLHPKNRVKQQGRFIWGFRQGEKEGHWKYDTRSNLLHNDIDTRDEPGPLTIMNFFGSVKNKHRWGK